MESAIPLNPIAKASSSCSKASQTMAGKQFFLSPDGKLMQPNNGGAASSPRSGDVGAELRRVSHGSDLSHLPPRKPCLANLRRDPRSRRCCRRPILRVVPQSRCSGYYAWRERPESEHAQQDHHLRVRVRASFDASRQRCGSPRVWEDLIEDGIHVSRKRVVRLMQWSSPGFVDG